MFRDSETNATLTNEIPINWGRLMFDDQNNPAPPPLQPESENL